MSGTFSRRSRIDPQGQKGSSRTPPGRGGSAFEPAAFLRLLGANRARTLAFDLFLAYTRYRETMRARSGWIRRVAIWRWRFADVRRGATSDGMPGAGRDPLTSRKSRMAPLAPVASLPKKRRLSNFSKRSRRIEPTNPSLCSNPKNHCSQSSGTRRQWNPGRNSRMSPLFHPLFHCSAFVRV